MYTEQAKKVFDKMRRDAAEYIKTHPYTPPKPSESGGKKGEFMPPIYDWRMWVYGGYKSPHISMLNKHIKDHYGSLTPTEKDDIPLGTVEEFSIMESAPPANMEKGFEKTAVTVRQIQYGKCGVIGCKKKKLTIHHIIPRAEGGRDNLENLIALCHMHHDKIEASGIRTRSEIENFVDDETHAEAAGRIMQYVPIPFDTVELIRRIAETGMSYHEMAVAMNYTEYASDAAGELEMYALNAKTYTMLQDTLHELQRRLRLLWDSVSQPPTRAGDAKKNKNRRLLRRLTNDDRIDSLSEKQVAKIHHDLRNFVTDAIDSLNLAV